MAYTKTAYTKGYGEITEKKSRFIANVQPVSSEEEALEFIAKMKKQYYDARHNCYAYIIGRNEDVKRSGDDGEPSGTAGRPMLNILEKEGIYNTAVVVTRYFGGVLLGTGGLVRAYQEATQEGLRNTKMVERCAGYKMHMKIPYTLLGKMQYMCAGMQLPIVETVYEEEIFMTILVPTEEVPGVIKEVMAQTDGKIEPTEGEYVEYISTGDGVEIIS